MVDPATLASLLVEAAPDGLILVDGEGRIVLANAQTERLFGYARAELAGQPVEVLMPERHRTPREGRRGGFFADPPNRPMGASVELYGRRKDGSEFPVEISLSPVVTPDGTRFAAAAIRDATGRRKVEARFRALLEAAPDAMVIADSSGRIVLANQQAERIFGHPREALLRLRIEDLMPERHRADHAGHRETYAANPRVRPMGAGLELMAIRNDGSEFPVEISLSPLETEDGPLVSAAIRDVSERKRLEETQRAQSVARTLVRRLVVSLIQRASVEERVVRELGRELARDSGAGTLDEAIRAFRGMGLGELRLESVHEGTHTFSGSDLLERRRQALLPTCALSLSYLEGAVSLAAGLPALGAETRCQSRGHERCVFVVVARPSKT